jgi:sugar lactone lactonase YvrE
MTIAGTGVQGFSGDGGPAISASFKSPIGIVFDVNGNLLIVDSVNNRIRRVASDTGIITTVAGSGPSGNGFGYFSADGSPATSAKLAYPIGVAVDRNGNLLICEHENHRIRRVDARTGILTTFAGIGTMYNGVGFSGDGGSANRAKLNYPTDIALDHDGNLLIADCWNNRIRRVAANTGIITTLAEGLSVPTGVAVDGSGNVFIAETYSMCIRRVAAGTGVITTVAGAGGGVYGFSGDGGPATSALLDYPSGVAVDASGNLYIADTQNHRIRRVDARSRIITTVAGNGVATFAGDGGPATSASLAGPMKVALDSSGNLLIADTYNNRIRKVIGPFL